VKYIVFENNVTYILFYNVLLCNIRSVFTSKPDDLNKKTVIVWTFSILVLINMTVGNLCTLPAQIISPPECLGEVCRHEISPTHSSCF
jgi:hypothetical protein